MFFIRVDCIKSAELCFEAAKKCKGYYNFNQELSYEVKCKKKKCRGKQCNADYCGKDFFACHQFNRILDVLKALTKAKIWLLSTKHSLKASTNVHSKTIHFKTMTFV